VNIGPCFVRDSTTSGSADGTTRCRKSANQASALTTNCASGAWMNGYQVGYRFVPFKGPSGHYPADGGTVLFSNETRAGNAVRNSDTIFERYGKYTRRIDKLVQDANAGRESSLAIHSTTKRG
jgi:hypothetical protein